MGLSDAPAGTTPDGQAPLYLRACGPARATVTRGGTRSKVSGGFCELRKVMFTLSGDVSWVLSVFTGLVTNGPSPSGDGVWLMIVAGKRVRAGPPLQVFDGVVEVGGTRFAVHGDSTLRKRLAGGSFDVVAHGEAAPSGVPIRGSWTCR
jgi:hypothetical protein